MDEFESIYKLIEPLGAEELTAIAAMSAADIIKHLTGTLTLHEAENLVVNYILSAAMCDGEFGESEFELGKPLLETLTHKTLTFDDAVKLTKELNSGDKETLENMAELMRALFDNYPEAFRGFVILGFAVCGSDKQIIEKEKNWIRSFFKR